MVKKKTKICIVCGDEFIGTAGKITCDQACRAELYRLTKKGKKPEYWAIVQSKGFRMPKKRVKKESTKPPPTKSVFVAQAPPVYDAPKLAEPIIHDEPNTVLIPEVPMTIEQKWALKQKIQMEINKIKEEPLPPGMAPKAHWLDKKYRTDDLEEQLSKL